MNDESPPINEEKHINNNNEQESIQTQNTLSIYGSHLYAREHLARTRGKVDAGDAGRRLTEQQLRLGRLFPCCCALFDAVYKNESHLNEDIFLIIQGNSSICIGIL